MNLKIKVVKFILSIILMVISITIVCETNILKNDEILHGSTSAKYKFCDEDSIIIENIKKISSKTETTIYILENIDENVGEYGFKIAITDNDTSKLNIKTGEYNDLFFTKVKYIYTDISKVKKINENTILYIIGDEENIRLFNKEFSDIYENITFKFNSVHKNYDVIYFLVWIITALFLLSITVYEICVQKKEVFLKIIFGHSVWRYILINVFADMIIYLFALITDTMFLLNITCVRYYFYSILITVFIISLFTGISYLSFIDFDFKAITKDNRSPKLLLYNYIFKFISNSICIFCMSISLYISETAIGYMKLDTFVKEFKDYSLCEIYIYNGKSRGGLNTATKTEMLNEKIYREHFIDLKPLLLTNIIIYKDFSEEVKSFKISNDCCCNYMLTNIYAYNYLCSQIKDFKNCEISSDICILVPSFFTQKQKEEMIDTSLDIIKNTYGEHFSFDYQIFEYDDNIKLASINGAQIYRLRLNENPAIIYYSLNANTIDTPLYEMGNGNYMYNVLYCLDENLCEKIKKEYSLEKENMNVTNLYDFYIQNCLVYKATACLVYFIIFMFLLVDISISITIVILNYKINSTELAIKKINGYSLIEKNIKMIVFDFLILLLSLIVNLAILQFLAFCDVKYIFIFSSFICLIQLICVTIQILKSENMNIDHVLKCK